MIRGIFFMVNDKSLVSLALMKTNWEEQQKDFVDMLIPFVLYSISSVKCDEIVSITDTRNKIKNEFGIDIYNNVIETFFKRISSNRHYKNPYLRKEKGTYYRTNEFIDIKSFEQARNIYIQNQEEVINYFLDFLKDKKIDFDETKAKKELISYLCKYGHNLLENNLVIRENTIWTKRIGEFIEWSYKSDLSIFNYLKDIAKGGMLSVVYFNSNKEVKISQKFKNTEIYFDTPLLMFILNYSGDALQKTVQELVNLLYDNSATVCTFEHNLIELEGILNAYISRYRNGSLNTSYNFDYLIENDVKPEKIESDIPSLRYMLKAKKIYVKDTPNYNDYWKNIGVSNFDQYLSKNIHYKKDDRRDNDVKSIAAIYQLRDRPIYYRYETCKALFVATNSYLVYHTQKYFKSEEHRNGIPAIVDDTFLTSLLWLKSVKRDDTLPTLKLVADALAAQEPSQTFWDNFIEKLNELKSRDEITEDELVELKYGLFSKKNMFDVTEGDSTKITHETVKIVQQMNFRMQHKEIIEEKEQAINEKNSAINEKNLYQKKYNESYIELIKEKSIKYINQIKNRKKLLNILVLFVACIIIYSIINCITNIFGIISNIKEIINIGATAMILFISSVINLFIDKFISNQIDKMSIKILNSYIKKIYTNIRINENSYAEDIISLIKQELELLH